MSQKFYYDSGSEKLGPVSGGELLRLLAEGSITPETWVRRAESSTWRHLSDIDLKKEKEVEKKRSIRRALWSQLTPTTIVGIICLLLFFVGMLFAAGVVVTYLWPLLLIVIFAWWIMRVMK